MRFCQILSLGELIDDERFRSNAQRIRNRTVLIPILEERLRSRTSSEWLAALEESDIPCAPINSVQECMRLFRKWGSPWTQTMNHSSLGELLLPAPPIAFDGTEPGAGLAPPELGEQTHEVLAELGYGDQTIEELRARGCV